MAFFTFVKLMMTLVDLLIFLSGTTIMALGLWVSLDRSTFLHLLGPFPDKALEFLNIGYYCIATGGVMVLLGLMGFCGTKKESRCLLLGLSGTTIMALGLWVSLDRSTFLHLLGPFPDKALEFLFFSIVLIVFIAQVAAAAVLLYYSEYAGAILKEWLKNMYGSDTMITNIWNSTMLKMNCCGCFNYTDFLGSKFEAQNQGNLPPSCCMTNIRPCSHTGAERTLVKGCCELILVTLKYYSNIVGGIVASIGGLEIAAMVMSTYLYCYLDK